MMRWSPAFAVLAVVVVASGCGSSSETSTSSTTPVGGAATVVMKNVEFNPSTVTVRAGKAVLWKWEDGLTQHDVVFSDFRSDLKSQGTYSHTFATPGTYSYKCDVHPAMVGVVHVNP
jgi:plastocyanin